jgi:hypothetical protein
VKKTQEEKLGEKNAFYKKKLGFFGSVCWNMAPPPNPNFFT